MAAARPLVTVQALDSDMAIDSSATIPASPSCPNRQTPSIHNRCHFQKQPQLNRPSPRRRETQLLQCRLQRPQKDFQFQFMNTVRVVYKPLNLAYIHRKGDNRAILDGTLVWDPSNKVSANYVIESGNYKLKYSYNHKGFTIIEPTYDVAKNSWDFAVSGKVYGDDLFKREKKDEMVGIDRGIQDVRAEDITAVHTESGIRIKTAVGRGGYVKDIYVKRMTMHTMKWAFWITGNYGSHADKNYDHNALPEIKNINYRDMVAEDVAMAANLEGISNDPFTQICISNVTISMAAKAKKQPWTCNDIEGITSGVTPKPCGLLPDQGTEKIKDCDFPLDYLPIDMLELKKCSYSI